MPTNKTSKKSTTAKRNSRTSKDASSTRGRKRASSVGSAGHNGKTTKPKSDQSVASGNTKRLSGLYLAADVLAKAGKPLNAKSIAERVIAAGWKTNGKTPHATIYASIVREISRRGDASRFRKTDRGMFEHATSKGGKS